MREGDQQRMLVVKAGRYRVGVPLTNVRETMRPLPLQPLRDAPAFTLGLSVIRGESVPVVDLGACLGSGGQSADISRFVTLAVAERTVALAVHGVEGVTTVSDAELEAMPPLLAGAAGGVVERLAQHDGALLLVLEAGRVFPTAAERHEALP